jgi:3'(2'), 5'-bisphosphate nucleotidase
MSYDLPSLLPPLLTVACNAGREILAVYSQNFGVARKADRSPVTEADLRSQRVVVAGLKRLTPDLPILAEESTAVPYDERARWRELWLVDPLDGTQEFVNHNPEFTVNIALIRDGRPVIGVVHAPAQDLYYFGVADGGERLQPRTGAFRQLAGEHPAAIHVTVRAQPPLRVVASRSHRGDSLDGLLSRLGPHDLRPIGSSLKLCLIAEGSADFYPRLGLTSEWDTAAGQAVVECAGGHVVDLHGRPLRYNTRDGLINPEFIAYGDSSHDWLGYF